MRIVIGLLHRNFLILLNYDHIRTKFTAHTEKFSLPPIQIILECHVNYAFPAGSVMVSCMLYSTFGINPINWLIAQKFFNPAEL